LKKKKAIVSVINDLVTDQRVHRTCLTLADNGYDVLLIGRQKKNSLPLPERPYSSKRMKLFFETGALFYIEYQFRLFKELIFHRADLLFANDLDTLLPNYLASIIKLKPIIYDSHEYFTGVPELQNNALKRGAWKMLERAIIPKLGFMITVNNSIAKLYHDEFGVNVKVMRNLPVKRDITSVKTKKELGLPEDKSIVLLQGAGINVNRGAEEAVEAMQYTNNALLLIIGGGDVIEQLKGLAQKLKLEDKVKFIPKLPFEELMNYTTLADIGLTLDKDTNVNYRYSLPNKLFDYIHAGIPVLASPLVEVKNIIESYHVGECIETHEPKHIADKLNSLLGNKEKLKLYKANALKAKEELCWEKEKSVLEEILKAQNC
jgi:glycosyltransferase involved in cell wall biosynthesis